MSETKVSDILIEGFHEFGITYTDETIFRFLKYMEHVLQWNENVNLTAITDHKEFVIKHFIDSLSCTADAYFNDAETVIDIGTGAGFPGLPLAMTAVDKQFLLVDSLNKRVKILQSIIDDLDLKNVTVLHARAEEMAFDERYREQFDICVSRAVSRLSVLSEYCLPFAREGGYFGAYKGSNYEEELADAKKAIHILGGELIEISDKNMPKFGLFHRILYIKKINKTPSKYPRKPGIPEKSPL